MRCLVEACVSDAPYACQLVGRFLCALRNEYAAAYLGETDAMGMSVAPDGLPIETSNSPTTSESERHDCNDTAHLIKPTAYETTLDATNATDATHRLELQPLGSTQHLNSERFASICSARSQPSALWGRSALRTY